MNFMGTFASASVWYIRIIYNFLILIARMEVTVMKEMMIFGCQLVGPVNFHSPHGRIANSGRD